MNWEQLATGQSGDIELEKAWLRKAQEIYELFCKKQHDYGPTNIGMAGIRGVAIRTADKVARLWELSGLRGEEKEANNESLRDTLMDIADYGIIALMVHDQDWPEYDIREVFSF